MAVVVAALGIGWVLLAFSSFPGAEGWGYDYLAYRDAAQRLVETGTPYQAETLDGPYRPGPYGLYMYAPPLAIALGPLAELPSDSGVVLWYALHLLVLGLACWLMPIPAPLRLAAFGVAALSYPVTRDLLLGNVSILLLLPMAAAWRWLDRPLGSVAQALAIAVRPTLGILVVWQLLRRRWSAVCWTLAAGLVLVGLSLPFVGLQGYVDYLSVLQNLTGVTGVFNNRDLSSTLMSLGMDDRSAELALLGGYAIAVGAVLLSLRRDREVGFMVTLTASLLLSPLLWDHYLATLVLPAAFLAHRVTPFALTLPLLTWLPGGTFPLLVLVLLGLPLLLPSRPAPVRGSLVRLSEDPERSPRGPATV